MKDKEWPSRVKQQLSPEALSYQTRSDEDLTPPSPYQQKSFVDSCSDMGASEEIAYPGILTVIPRDPSPGSLKAFP